MAALAGKCVPDFTAAATSMGQDITNLRGAFRMDRDDVARHPAVNDPSLARKAGWMMRGAGAPRYCGGHGERCPAGVTECLARHGGAL